MKEIGHGNVFEIPLMKNMGYAYVRIVDPDELFQSSTIAVLVEIYKHKRLTPLEKDYDIRNLPKIGFLISPLIMISDITLLKKYSWRLVGNIPVSENYIIPDFVWCSNKTLGKPERFTWYSWNLIKDLGLKGPHAKVSYNECKDLEIYQHISVDLIVMRLTMEWIKAEGKEMKDFFGKEDFAEPWTKVIYNQTMFHSSANIY